MTKSLKHMFLSYSKVVVSIVLYKKQSDRFALPYLIVFVYIKMKH